MFKNWFLKMSWIYVPISPIGAVITSIIVVLNAWFFKAVDAHSHSPSDTLLNFFPYAVSLWVIYGWIAKQTVTKN
jgi:hypothetical protein